MISTLSTQHAQCVMYTQVVGCALMGFTVKHKHYLFDSSNSRFHRALYVAITSGTTMIPMILTIILLLSVCPLFCCCLINNHLRTLRFSDDFFLVANGMQQELLSAVGLELVSE